MKSFADLQAAIVLHGNLTDELIKCLAESSNDPVAVEAAVHQVENTNARIIAAIAATGRVVTLSATGAAQGTAVV